MYGWLIKLKAMEKINFKTVDEYIAMQPEDKQEALEHLRQLIRTLVPQAEEGISYQIPMYKYHGMLCGFAGFKNHCSFTTANGKTLSLFQEDLKGFKFSPSIIHFQPNKPIPEELLERIILQRVAENEQKAAEKKRK